MTGEEQELLEKYLTHLNVLGDEGDYPDFEAWYQAVRYAQGPGRLRGSKSIDRCSSLIYHHIDRTPHASRKIGAPRGGIFCPVIST